jgi:hypothetical protein
MGFASVGIRESEKRGFDLALARGVVGREAEEASLGRGRRQKEACDRERLQAALRRQKK